MLKRYGLAIALAGLALFLRGLLPVSEGTAIFQLSIAAVILSAWYGGRGPGSLALLACATGGLYWFIPPVNSFELAPDHALPLLIFIALCLLLSEFSAGRRHAEHALRTSEDRFRVLVQFSFDAYWETDAKHRLTRQEFSDRLTNAPASGAEIGRTCWEVPCIEPDEEGWRKHRAMLDAHLPFRDFELAHPTAGDGTRYVSVSGFPVFDQSGRFMGHRGVGRDITERKRAEVEHQSYLRFLESMDRIHRVMQGTSELERMMSEVLDTVLEVFACDRAWLIYPCVPDAQSWRAVMERTRPEFPGAFALRGELPMTEGFAEVARMALASEGVLPAGPGHERAVKPEVAEQFGVRSEMLMALHPKGARPYLFGMHQCERPRTWSKEEQRLFEEIGHRLGDALSSLIAFRSLRESERRLEAAQQVAHVGWWERDFVTGRVSLSDEACRVFGVQPLDLPQWHGRWLSLIHPEDRSRTAAASEAALGGGARYDVEYRVVHPDGTVRMVHSQGDVTRDDSGRPLRQFGVMQDITTLWHAQQELRASEQRLCAANAALKAQAVEDQIQLREREARLSALAGSTDEVVFEFDGNGKYLNVWTKNETLLFRPRHELIGRTLAEVFDEGWALHHVERLQRVLASGTSETWQYRIDLPSGRAWFLGRMTPMPSIDGARHTVCCLVRDITQQKRDEASRGAQYGVALALADSDSIATAAPQLLAAIGKSMDWDWGAFWTVDRGRDQLSCEARWHGKELASAELNELSHEITLKAGDHGVGRVCETAQPDWVANLAAHRGSDRQEAAAHAGLRSGVAFPILDLRLPVSSNGDSPSVVVPAFAPSTGTVEITGQTDMHPMRGEVLGVLEFFSRYPQESDTDQLAVFNVIGGQIGQFIKRRRAESELQRRGEELRARQEMLDLAQAAARAVAFDWYVGARVSENRWSPELEAMYGLEPGTFNRTKGDLQQFVHPDDWPAVKLAIDSAQDSGDFATEYRVNHQDGTVHWLRAKGRVFLDAAGRPERMVGFMIDVSDRRRAEEKLRASEERFRTLVDHATDGLFLLDEHAVIVDVNRHACEGLGYRRDELIGMHRRDFDAGLDAGSIAQLEKRVGAGETVTFETLHRRKDGSVFPVEIRVREFQQGQRRLHLSIVRNITERRLAEQSLRAKDTALEMARTELARVSRLTTLGELTTSIAHEVSQPLGAMVASAGACARWLAARPPAMAEAQAALDNIVADGKRARDVIARIRTLTRGQAPRKHRLDINHKITEVLALMDHELRSHGVRLQKDLAGTLPVVAGDRVQLQQVLLNLVMNAIEAMSDVHDRPRELTVVSRQDGAAGVLVEVHDSGIGLDPQRTKQVFEAFYTTKPEGIGIGLSISRSIIEAHGGRLWASGNSPHGAVFSFWLPSCEEAIA